jgi:hypothetical protein
VPLGGVFAIGSWFPRSSLAIGRADPATLARQHVVLLHGEEDSYLTPAVANSSAALAVEAGLRDVEVLLFANVSHQCHAEQVDEICRIIVAKAPKPEHLPDPYIPPDQWLDYSHSRRTTGPPPPRSPLPRPLSSSSLLASLPSSPWHPAAPPPPLCAPPQRLLFDHAGAFSARGGVQAGRYRHAGACRRCRCGSTPPLLTTTPCAAR